MEPNILRWAAVKAQVVTVRAQDPRTFADITQTSTGPQPEFDDRVRDKQTNKQKILYIRIFLTTMDICGFRIGDK